MTDKNTDNTPKVEPVVEPKVEPVVEPKLVLSEEIEPKLVTHLPYF